MKTFTLHDPTTPYYLRGTVIIVFYDKSYIIEKANVSFSPFYFFIMLLNLLQNLGV